MNKKLKRDIQLFSLLMLSSIAVFQSCGLFESGTGVKINKNSLAHIPLVKGITNQSISMGKAGTLLFTLSIPKTQIASGKKTPFIIALHWGGQITTHFAEEYLKGLAEPGFRDLDAIILAPDVPGSSWSDPVSEDVILQLLTAAKHSWPIDPDKIVITGYSMGGNGTWYMIDQHPTKFSAGIPMASVPNGKLTGIVPTYIIHGKLDELFNYQNAENAYDILKDRGANVRIKIAENLSHYQGFSYVNYLKEAAYWLENSVWR